VVVAQLVRALDCGSRGRRFETGLPPNKKNLLDYSRRFFCDALFLKLLYICKYFSMNTKTKLKEQIDNFSEQFSINELIERLIIIEKIEIGKMQSENNQLISESGLEKGMDTWLM